VTPLADTPIANGGTWSGDGVIVFSAGIGRPLYRISAEGGQPTPVTHIQPGRTAHTSSWPYFLPDGKHFLYSVQWTVPGESGTGLYAKSLTSDQETLVSSEIAGNVAVFSGHLFFARGGKILAQPFDATALRLTGAPAAVTDQEVIRMSSFCRVGFRCRLPARWFSNRRMTSVRI